MIHTYLHRALSKSEKQKYEKILPKIAEQSSSTERRAESVEREIDKIYATRFMQNKIGHEFEGKIS